MVVRIKDIELIKDVDILFNSEIVLYGAGFWGRKIARLLEMAGIKATCFCDRNKNVGFELGEIVTIDELKAMTEQRKLSIIIASDLYHNEIINDLEIKGITNANIYSLFGLQRCIQLNINSGKFDLEFRRYVKAELDIMEKSNRAIGKSSIVLHIMGNIEYYQNPGILILQPGKVGSSTIKKSLEACNVPYVHVHNFIYKEDERLELVLDECKRVIRNKCEKVKIITLVREPIMREISYYMQELDIVENISMFKADLVSGVIDWLNYTANVEPYGLEFAWFDSVLKDLTGIDIFQYPFDREKGYTIINEGKWEILLLKLENLNLNEGIIGKFVGTKHFKLENGNESKNKRYRYIYSDIKKALQIPNQVIDKYYNHNERMDYFYTEEEKKKFLQKYQR